MNVNSKGLRVAPFVIALACFIMPFMSLSCQGSKLVTLTGVHLVTGSEMKDPVSGEAKNIPPEPRAIVACLALCAGTVLALQRSGKVYAVAVVPAAIFILAMLVMKTRLDAEITKQAAGLPISIEYGRAYWVALLAGAGGLVMCLISAWTPPSERAGAKAGIGRTDCGA